MLSIDLNIGDIVLEDSRYVNLKGRSVRRLMRYGEKTTDVDSVFHLGVVNVICEMNLFFAVLWGVIYIIPRGMCPWRRRWESVSKR